MVSKIQIAELNIKFTGDVDDLTKGAQTADTVVTASFKRVDKAGDDVTDSLDKVEKAGKRLDTGAVNLAARMQILTQAYDAFKNVTNKAVDLAKLGAQSERVDDRFRRFASTIGDSTEILEAFQRGAGGTIDKLTAMTNASALIQQGLVGTSAEMEKTVEFATRLGDQTLSAGNRISSFSQMLRNQSILMLDNFGISSGKVRRRIEELQDATEGLAREEAFRIAVFEEGQKSLNVLGERLDDTAMKFERAEAKMADMRVEMGEMLAPAISKVFGFISTLDTSTIALVTTLSAAAGMAIKFTGGLTGLAGKLGTSVKGLGAAGLATVALIGVWEAWNRLQAKVTEGQEKANAAMEAWPESVDKAVVAGVPLEKQVLGLANKVNKANDVLHQNGGVLTDLATAYARSTSETKIMTKAADEARTTIMEQTGSFEEANEMIRIYNNRVLNSQARLKELTILTFESRDEMDLWARSVDNAGFAIDNVASISLEELKRQQQEAADTAEVAAQAELDYAATFDILGQQLDMAAKRQRKRQMDYDREWEQQKKLKEIESERAIVATERAEAQRIASEEAMLALQKEIEAQEEVLDAQLRRSEALKDADAERVARAAISDLEKAHQAGILSFEEYAQAVVSIQDQFGLADDESRALTLGLGAVVEGLLGGQIAAEDMGAALQFLIEDAADGVVVFDELINRVDALGESVAGTVRDMGGGGAQAQGGVRDMGGGGTTIPRGERVVDAMTGQMTAARGGEQAGGVVIYGNIVLEGVENADDFLQQLMSLME